VTLKVIHLLQEERWHFSYLSAPVDKIQTDMARRAVSLQQQQSFKLIVVNRRTCCTKRHV